jgi:hypothetical protein
VAGLLTLFDTGRELIATIKPGTKTNPDNTPYQLASEFSTAEHQGGGMMSTARLARVHRD